MSASGIGSIERLAARLDAFTAWVGRIVAYLGVATVLICFATVYLRYAFGVGFVWLQESYIWTHCAAIMFGSSYAILRGGFVRVDIFYNRMSEHGKAWVDVFGTIAFLTPFLLMMAFSGWSFFLASWKMNERSAYESGLSGVYLLKGTILFFAFLVGVQALSILLRSVLVLLDRPPPPRPAGVSEKI